MLNKMRNMIHISPLHASSPLANLYILISPLLRSKHMINNLSISQQQKGMLSI
jgi:hypothetical protein